MKFIIFALFMALAIAGTFAEDFEVKRSIYVFVSANLNVEYRLTASKQFLPS
jgi:hypothetical protein